MENLCGLSQFENVFVKTSAFYALGLKKSPYDDLAGMIRKLHKAFGAKRLMWASDCPYQVQEKHTYADSISLIRDRLDFLSDEDKQWMLRGTAERVFFASATEQK
jgi:predicted TIM-barrel fold metal-dependent hydrolase